MEKRRRTSKYWTLCPQQDLKNGKKEINSKWANRKNIRKQPLQKYSSKIGKYQKHMQGKRNEGFFKRVNWIGW